MKNAVLEGGFHRGPKVSIRLGLHRNAGLELVYVRRGRTRWRVGETAVEVEPGSLFYTLPWEVHGGVRPQQPGLEIYWVVLEVGRTGGRLRLPPGLRIPAPVWRAAARSLLTSPHRCFVCPEAVGETLMRVAEGLRRPGAEEAARRTALLEVLLLDAARLAAEGRPAGRTVRDAATLRVMAWLDRVREHPADPVRLADAADACGLGRTRFADRVKALTGDSPIQYVNRMRVEHAAGRLTATAWPVGQIALDAGFESPRYFARVFRAFLGCTPTEYRGERRGIRDS